MVFSVPFLFIILPCPEKIKAFAAFCAKKSAAADIPRPAPSYTCNERPRRAKRRKVMAMRGKKWLALLCTAALLAAGGGFPAAADGQVLYDTDSGESLSALLNEGEEDAK